MLFGIVKVMRTPGPAIKSDPRADASFVQPEWAESTNLSPRRHLAFTPRISCPEFRYMEAFRREWTAERSDHSAVHSSQGFGVSLAATQTRVLAILREPSDLHWTDREAA